MTDGSFFLSLVEQLRAYPALVLIFFALPFMVLGWWKKIYPDQRLIALCFLPLVPTIGIVFPLAVRLVVALSTVIVPLFIWLYTQRRIDLWSVIYICLLTLAALVALLVGPLVTIVIVDVGIAIVALADLLSVPRNCDFEAERSCQKTASLKKKHPVSIIISNKSNRRITIEVRDDMPQDFMSEPASLRFKLAAKSRSQRSYKLTSSRRGAFEMNCMYLQGGSIFQLWRRVLNKPSKQTINVFPDLKQLAEYELLARTNRLSLLGVKRTRRIGQDNDFERLRDYTLDDNYKNIDWRSTARRQKLTVRDFQTTQSQRIVFLIDCGRMMTNKVGEISMFDHALNAMLMLSYVALKRGDSVGLVCFSDRIHCYVPPKGGQRQMNHLLQSSFDRFPELVESRYSEAFLHLSKHCRKRSLVILITNLIDEINANQIHKQLGTMLGRHLPLGVLLRDRDLFSAADTNWKTDSELYRAAAASEIICWRNDVIRDLRHQGVLSLDVDPEDMTAPLINQYLEVKARHLL